MPSEPTGAPAPPPAPMSGAYRAVWRWHFYAGLLVLPFLMLMALTGGVYLFKAEIDDWETRAVARVEAGPITSGPADWIAAATAAVPGRAATLLVPDRPDRALQVTVETTDGARRVVFIDPKDGRVTGDRPEGGVSETVKRLHSLVIAGPGMNLIVEVVAGWAMILVATGLFLWWPRRRDAGVLTVRARSGRPLWRDLHAVTGLYAGGVIFFLAFTGMPWSAVWGDTVMGAARDAGFGRPAAPTAAEWTRAGHGDHAEGVGWTLERGTMTAPNRPLDLNAVVASVEAAGLAPPYLISLPASPDRAATAAVQNSRAEDARVLYLDRSGRLIRDVTWSQFGAGAQAFEWGIAVHEGRQYGQINRWIMLSACVATWVLSISALTMWWKRRPKGRLGAPTAPPGPRLRAAVLGIVIPFCIVYPLTGLSLLAALAVDQAWTLARRRAAT